MNSNRVRLSIHVKSDILANEEDIDPTEESPVSREKSIRHRHIPLTEYKSFLDEIDAPIKASPVKLSVDDAKKKLQDSIAHWGELLLSSNTVNSNNRSEFDDKRVLYASTFNDTQQRHIFEEDIAFARQSFFNYLDILNVPEIHRFLSTISWSTLSDAILESNFYIIIHIVAILAEFVLFRDDDLPTNYDLLLNAMRTNVEVTLQSSTPRSSTKKSIHMGILSFLWNLADHTTLVPCLIRNGFAKSILDWFVIPNLSADESRCMINIIHNLSRHDQGADELNKHHCIEIMKAWQKKQSSDTWEISFITTMTLAHLYTPDQIKADPSGTKSILDQLLQVTMRAADAPRYRYEGFHVSEPLSVLAKIFVDDATVDYVLNSAQTDPPANATSTIHLFSKLLIKFRPALSKEDQVAQFTFIALCNIIWSISFHEAYHSILKEDLELINTIRALAEDQNLHIVEQYVPRTMFNIKKAADGILFNLDLEQELTSLMALDLVPHALEKPVAEHAQQERLGALRLSSVTSHVLDISPAPPPKPIISSIPMNGATMARKPLVMISYSHDNSHFCGKILKILDSKAELFDVWIDKRCCKSCGDVWESIARGIKSANLIICIISTEYLASKPCRQEVIYAKDRLDKPFLPVYMEKPTVSEWLDIRLAEFKYIRFRNINSKLDESKVEEFLSTVIESILPGQQNSKNTNISVSHTDSHVTHAETKIVFQSHSTVASDSHSILQWTPVEINRWFAQNQISNEIRDLYDFKTGAQMMIYAECFTDGWQKQYDRYAPRYAELNKGKQLPEHEFALFVGALKELYTDHIRATESSHLSKSVNNRISLNSNPKSSSWCTIL